MLLQAGPSFRVQMEMHKNSAFARMFGTFRVLATPFFFCSFAEHFCTPDVVRGHADRSPKPAGRPAVQLG